MKEKIVRNYKPGTWGYWLFYHGPEEKWFSVSPKESQKQLNKLLGHHKFRVK